MRNNYVTYIVAMQPYLSQLRWLLCVATVSSLPQSEFEMDTEKQRQRRRNDVRLIKSRNARSEQLLVVPIQYRVAFQQRMAARRALEWIRTSKAQLVFRYEISDLFFLLLPEMCIDGFHSIISLWQLEGKGSCDVDIDQSAGSVVM